MQNIKSNMFNKQQTKQMEEIKNTPLENFDWDAYENGTVETAAQKEDQEKAYDRH